MYFGGACVKWICYDFCNISQCSCIWRACDFLNELNELLLVEFLEENTLILRLMYVKRFIHSIWTMMRSLGIIS